MLYVHVYVNFDSIMSETIKYLTIFQQQSEFVRQVIQQKKKTINENVQPCVLIKSYITKPKIKTDASTTQKSRTYKNDIRNWRRNVGNLPKANRKSRALLWMYLSCPSHNIIIHDRIPFWVQNSYHNYNRVFNLKFPPLKFENVTCQNVSTLRD